MHMTRHSHVSFSLDAVLYLLDRLLLRSTRAAPLLPTVGEVRYLLAVDLLSPVLWQK